MRDSSDSEAVVEKLQEMKTAIDEGDFKAATKFCEGLLHKRAESMALTCVVYQIYVKLLLHQNLYEKVLGLSPPHNECWATLEPLRAYAFYRLDQHDRALQLAQKFLASAEGSGIEHIQAQSFFHLNDTTNALKCYNQMVENDKSDGHGHDHENEESDYWTEVYTNTMAVLIANSAPYDADDLTQFIRSKVLDIVQPQGGSFPFELAYNLASLKLLSANTMAARREALSLLQQAHRACHEVFADDEGQLKQELHPIELNLDWGRKFWGEDAPACNSTSPGTANTSNELNSILKNQINPVLLQASAREKVTEKTIFALELLLQRGNIKLSTLQKRLCYYNMAVLHLRLGDYDACRQSLNVLTRFLTDPIKPHKNPKAQAVAMPPSSALGSIWWQVRVDVLLAYSYSLQCSKHEREEHSQKQLQEIIFKLNGRLDNVNSMDVNSMDEGADETCQLRDHTAFYLQLHLKQLTAKNEFTSEVQLQWLQSYCSDENMAFHAVTATLAKAYQDLNQPEKAKELLLSDRNNKISNNNTDSCIIVEMAMVQENYTEAVTLHDQALIADPSNHGLRARLVEGLSHVDPQRAITEWKIIRNDIEVNQLGENDEEDGETLETRELPRIKHAAGTDGGPFLGGTVADSESSGKKKSEKVSILRRRAKQRKVHLEQLQQKGLYNPLRPTLPDAERWTAKQERQKRRRRGGAQNKASQGGVSIKDAAKLDVAARAAGADGGTSTGPSTAHLTVAGGPRKGGRRR